MLSGLTKINCILVIVILSSILAAGILQDTFAGEKLEKASAGGEVETTGGYFYRPGRKFGSLSKAKGIRSKVLREKLGKALGPPR